MTRPNATPVNGTGIINNVSAWDALRSEWDELFSRSATCAPPLRFSWLRSWWQVYGAAYGESSRSLHIVTWHREGKLVGLLPLYQSVSSASLCNATTLRFLSTGEARHEETCPDYLNLLCPVEETSNCMQSLRPALAGARWDRIELQDIPRESPLANAGALSGGKACIGDRGVCHIANLEGGFDAYLGRLSPKPRQHARQYLRAAIRAGAHFELATAANCDEIMDDLIALHEERWRAEGQTGCFASDRFREFHRRLVRESVPKGEAILARLSVRSRAVAVLYGFVCGNKFDFYQSGVSRDETSGVSSAGTTVILMLMQELLNRNVTKFDFLRGSSSYKTRLATEERPLCSVSMTRPGIRSLLFGSNVFVDRVVRRIAKRPIAGGSIA